MLLSSSIFVRNDILWLLPAIAIAFYQVKIVWGRLGLADHKETEIRGEYTHLDEFRISYLIYSAYSLLLLQLPLVILPMQSPVFIELGLRFSGYIIILTGLFTSLSSLTHLKTNWTGLSEYRIKKCQTLTTTGPYKYIRHPIYASTIYELMGFELVANSWLFLAALIFGLLFIYKHSLKEEALLERKFGNAFIKYKSKTKMFIPFIF